MNKAFFNDIRNEILNQISSAKKEINIAMAWFTNQDLLDALNSEAVLISFDKFVKHDLDECNLYHSFCGFSKEFIIDGQPSEVFQP